MKFKRVLKYLFFLMILGFLTFLYGFSSARNSAKKVTEIVIVLDENDNQFLSYEIVDKLLIQNNETLENQAKTKVDLYNLENGILENPYVEKASVFLSIDGTLKSVIKQRTPIARIINDNQSYYVDKKGVKVPVSENFSARVPLITGIKNEVDLNEIMALLLTISEDDFLHKEIIGIHKSVGNEYQFSDRSGDYKIDFGTLEEKNSKFKKLKAFYNVAFKDETIKEYKKITIKYHNQVVCSK